MPGLVDTHVHINEPGRTEWEGFHTATRAAAAGGVTTLIDMPLNSIPATTTVAALETKRKAAKNKCWVNVGFWGGVVPGNAGQLKALSNAGVFGFKCFLVPSGVAEFEGVAEADLRAALPELAAVDLPLLVHAELPGPIEAANKKLERANRTAYKTWLQSRPPEAETQAIELMIRLARGIQGPHPHRSRFIRTIRAAPAARARSGAASFRRNVPALSFFRLLRDSQGTHGVQMRAAHPRCSES